MKIIVIVMAVFLMIPGANAAPNSAPVADAGGPYVLPIGNNLLLDASESYDPDGDTLQYDWFLLSIDRTEGGQVCFQEPSDICEVPWSLVQSTVGNVPGHYLVELDAHDGNGGATFAPTASLELTSEVPLPAAAWLFGSGLLGLAAMKRKRS